jgi:hypothetical protein
MRPFWVRRPEARISETGGHVDSVESDLSERVKRVHSRRRQARLAGDSAAEERALRELIDIEQAGLRAAAAPSRDD